jgi:hypothetical protein
MLSKHIKVFGAAAGEVRFDHIVSFMHFSKRKIT